MKLLAVRFEDYKKNKIIRGINNKIARQFICLGGTKFFDLLQPVQEIERRKEKEVTIVDFFGDNSSVVVEESYTANLEDLPLDKSVCGIGVDLWDFRNGYSEVLNLGLPIFVYVDCKGAKVHDCFVEMEVLREYSKELIYVLDTDLTLMEYREMEELVSKLKTTRLRVIGKSIFKIGGTSIGGMFPSWFIKKYKLDLDYNYMHDTTQVGLLAEDFDYIDGKQEKYYTLAKIKERS